MMDIILDDIISIITFIIMIITLPINKTSALLKKIFMLSSYGDNSRAYLSVGAMLSPRAPPLYLAPELIGSMLGLGR